MQTVQKAPRRAGTSFVEFEDNFPDNKSCLNYIMAIRLKDNIECHRCGNSLSFKKISKRNSYLAKCCVYRIISPFEGTIFARTQLSLVFWFRTLLYFTNASTGINPSFISQQFNLMRSSSVRVCQLIRQHLLSVDDSICLGENGRSVYVSQTTIKSISRHGKKNGVRYRMLMATDGVEFLVIPIPLGKLAKSRHLLLDRLHPYAPIVTHCIMLKRKILNFYKSSRVKGHPIEASNNPYEDQFNELSVCVIALKMFILRSHHWVSEQHLESYVGHFAFLYRRRYRGHEAFWDAISHFPQFRRLS